MSNYKSYTRGETIVIIGDVALGDNTVPAVVRASIKPVALGNVSPGDTVEGLPFAVAYDDTQGNGRYTLTLTAAQTASLSTGNYIADIVIEQDGITDITAPFLIELMERVTV